MTENNQVPPLPPTPLAPPRRRRRSFFWPIMLISIGVLLLLSNLGIVSWTTWSLIWRFWPLILIAIGVDVLIGQRSAVGAVISGFLILALIGGVAAVVFLVDEIPYISTSSGDTTWKTEHVEGALADYESATVLIDWTSPPGNLSALADSDNLIEGDITYQGELNFDVRSRGSRADVLLDTRWSGTWDFQPFQSSAGATWDVYLTPEIPLDLTLDSGSGGCDFDLSELTLTSLFLDSGSGAIKMALPEGSSYPVTLDSGSGSVQITIPDNTGIRVNIDSGSGSFNPGNRFELVSGEHDGDGIWETDDYDSAKYTIDMVIDQGSGSITFR